MERSKSVKMDILVILVPSFIEQSKDQVTANTYQRRAKFNLFTSNNKLLKKQNTYYPKI